MSEEVCRLCLSSDNLFPIFVNIDKSERYTIVLGLTTGLKIEQNDGLPQQICLDCTKLVNSALKLRNQSHLTEMRLLQRGYRRTVLIEYTNCSDINKNIQQNDVNNEENNLSIDDSSNDDYVNNGFNDLEYNDKKMKDSQNKIRNNKCQKRRKVRKRICKKFQKTASTDTKREIKTRKEKKALYMSLVDGALNPQGPVRCKICKKSVSKWSCFISHAKLHLGFKFMCEYCGKSFISSTQLKRHCRSYHGMQRELACRHCGYLALDNAQLVLHERRMHTGERPYVCDVCAASYFSRRCLVQHIESHRTTASVQCDRCPSLLKSRRHLARHRYSAHARAARTRTVRAHTSTAHVHTDNTLLKTCTVVLFVL